MSRWKRFNAEQIQTLHKAPGVFAVYVAGKLSYIGQSLNIKKRLEDFFFRNDLYRRSVDPAKCYAKVSYSKTLGDWLLREIRLSLRLSPPWNKNLHTWKDFRGLRDRGEGYLELPLDFVLDPYADWMIILRDQGKSDNEIATYLNKCQSQKRWTPNAVHRVLRKYDSYSTEVAA